MSSSLFEGPPDRYADTLPGVHDLFRSRWSPRSFSPREVSAADLQTILDAARWAASSSNEQPWRFLIALKSDPAAYAKMLGLLVPGNQTWAKRAPVLMLTAAKLTFSQNGQPNYHALHDTGAALAHLFLQATALGLHAHGMAGFDRARARHQLNIPADYDPAAAVALGYLDSPDKLTDEKNRQQEVSKRERKPLSEIVFGAAWGEPLITS